MDKLRKHIRAEGENVEIALDNLKQTIEREEKTVIELAAIGTFLHNIYNGVENILKQIIVAKGSELPMSDTWHKDLLNLSVFMGIVSEELSDELYRYLTFRHFFAHAYGFMIEETHLEDLVNDIPEIWSQFLSETENYLKK
jgi:uncharacterized protein YutE (UPF0331/DUF86 family)